MSTPRYRSILTRALGRGPFPHQLAWLIDNPLRALFITPSTLADRLQLTESSTVLEIGPGSGYFSVELAKRVPRGRLELMDLQPEMLSKAASKLARRGYQNVGFTAANAADPLPYQDASFDIIVLVAALGEIQHPSACLKGISRILKDNGVLAVHEHVPDPDRIPFPEMRSLMTSNGYELRSRHGPFWSYTAQFIHAR